MIKTWISAFRLRTLPLAFSCIIMGSALADYYGYFRIEIFILALLTTLSLQILANLANDFGDFHHGVDNSSRIGPDRVMQQGLVTKNQMITMMLIFTGLSSIFGVWLIIKGVVGHYSGSGVILAALGLGAIAASLKYTVGNNPYGYVGFGDFFVFLFFGLVGVTGVYFLHTNTYDIKMLLPAVSIGLLSTGVLNINNMRDREQDELHGKLTLAVKLGDTNARLYHLIIMGMSVVSIILFTDFYILSPFRFLFMLIYPFIIYQAIRIKLTRDNATLDPHLKLLSLSTFALSILYWIGLRL